MATEKGIPFRLLDEGLDGLKRTADVTTNLMLAFVGAGRAETQPVERRSPRPERADTTGRARRSSDDPIAAAKPGPGDTAAAPSALATALDDEAKAAIEKAAGRPGNVTDGLTIEDEGGARAPDQELGPKPFAPQIGP